MPSKSPKKKNRGAAPGSSDSAAAKANGKNGGPSSSNLDIAQSVAPHNPAAAVDPTSSTSDANACDYVTTANVTDTHAVAESSITSVDTGDGVLPRPSSPVSSAFDSLNRKQDPVEVTPDASEELDSGKVVGAESMVTVEAASETMTDEIVSGSSVISDAPLTTSRNSYEGVGVGEGEETIAEAKGDPIDIASSAEDVVSVAAAAVSESLDAEKSSVPVTSNEAVESSELPSDAPAPVSTSSMAKGSDAQEADIAPSAAASTATPAASTAKEKKLMAYIKQQKLTIRKLEQAAAKKATDGIAANDNGNGDNTSEQSVSLPACLIKHPPRWLALRAVSSGLFLPWQRLVGFDSVRLRQGWHAWVAFTQEAAASGEDGKASAAKILTPAQQVEQLTAKNTRLRGLLSRSQNIAGRLREDLESARSGAAEREGRLLAEINALREEKLGLESAIRAAALSSDFAEDYELQLQKAETVALTKRNTTRTHPFNSRATSYMTPSYSSMRDISGRLGEQHSSETQSTLHPAAQPDLHDDDYHDKNTYNYEPNLTSEAGEDEGLALAYERSLELDKLRTARDAVDARAKDIAESLAQSRALLAEVETRAKADRERAATAMEALQQERQTLLATATAAKRKASEATSRCSDLEAELAAVAASQDVVKGGLQEHFQRAADAATQSLRNELTTTQTALASAQLELTEARAAVELAASKEAAHKNTVEELEDAQDTVRALRQALAKAHGGFLPYGDTAVGSHTHSGRSNGAFGSQMAKNKSESGLGIGPFGIAAGVSSANGTGRFSKGGHNSSHAKELAIVAAGSQNSEAAAVQSATMIKEAKACLKVLAKEASRNIKTTTSMHHHQRTADRIASAQSTINALLQPMVTGPAKHQVGSAGGEVQVDSAKLMSNSSTQRLDEKALLPRDIASQEDASQSARRATLLSQLDQVMEVSRGMTASAPSRALPAAASVADAIHAVLEAATAAEGAVTEASAAASAAVAADAQSKDENSAQSGSKNMGEDDEVLVLASHVRLIPGKSFELPLPVSHPRTLVRCIDFFYCSWYPFALSLASHSLLFFFKYKLSFPSLKSPPLSFSSVGLAFRDS